MVMWAYKAPLTWSRWRMRNNISIMFPQAAFGPPVFPTGYSTDWYGQILRNAVEQSHGISLSGASDKTKYLLSVGYADDQGIVIGNDYKRFTVRSNNEFQLADNLKLGTLVSYTNDINQNVNLVSAYNDAYRAAPVIPGMVNGKYGNTSLFQNVGNPILDIKVTIITGRWTTGCRGMLSWNTNPFLPLR